MSFLYFAIGPKLCDVHIGERRGGIRIEIRRMRCSRHCGMCSQCAGVVDKELDKLPVVDNFHIKHVGIIGKRDDTVHLVRRIVGREHLHVELTVPPLDDHAVLSAVLAHDVSDTIGGTHVRAEG